jgi:hypothetical protein
MPTVAETAQDSDTAKLSLEFDSVTGHRRCDDVHVLGGAIRQCLRHSDPVGERATAGKVVGLDHSLMLRQAQRRNAEAIRAARRCMILRPPRSAWRCRSRRLD